MSQKIGVICCDSENFVAQTWLCQHLRIPKESANIAQQKYVPIAFALQESTFAKTVSFGTFLMMRPPIKGEDQLVPAKFAFFPQDLVENFRNIN